MKAECRWLDFKIFGDDLGKLISLEKGSIVPFDVKRVYYIFGTKSDAVRGKHAHRELSQILVAVSGSLKVSCEIGGKKEEFVLDRNNKGLLIEGLVWHTMYDFSPDAVLMVVASDYYDEKDYVRDYQEFLKLTEQNQ